MWRGRAWGADGASERGDRPSLQLPARVLLVEGLSLPVLWVCGGL